MGSYTTVAQTNRNTIQGKIRPRSQAAPMTIAGVNAANIPWNKAKSKSGVDPDGAANTPLNPTLSKFPMNFPPVFEKTREYPQRNHWFGLTWAVRGWAG